MKLNVALLGSPGAAKSTVGLSFPGVEQHVFGSSEETTALNFPNRTDILIPRKSDWFDCLTDAEKAKFTDDKSLETELAPLMAQARARNIIKYRRYLYRLKAEMNGEPIVRTSLKGEVLQFKPTNAAHEPIRYDGFTVFLDNGTPFADDFQDYVKVVYAKEFETKEGNYNSIAFSIKYKSEIADFLRMLCDLPCNVVASFHIAMTLDEANAAKANFMEDSKKGVKFPKEWQPMLMGQAKYILPGIFDYAFFLWVKENPGLDSQYLAKLEADDSTVGIAKSRLQPFENPREIMFPKNNGYAFLKSAIEGVVKTGKPSPSRAK